MNREPLTSLLLADTTSAGMLGTSRVDDARKGITSAAAAAPAAAGTSAGGLLREGSERRRGMENSLKFSCSSFPLFICFLQNNFISLAQSLLARASKCSLPVSISMRLSLSIGRSLPLPFFFPASLFLLRSSVPYLIFSEVVSINYVSAVQLVARGLISYGQLEHIC